MIIRGSGIAAFALLTASTAWGLLVSSKLLTRMIKAKPLTWFHESLGIGALLATVIHITVLSVHDYLDFTWAEILVPGKSDWRALPVALGIMAFYCLTIVVVSFYVKKWIGQKMWRTIHFISIGVFVSALAHGITAGTDTKSPMMIGIYAGSLLVVSVLLAYRLSNADRRPAAATAGPGRTPVAELVERSLSRDHPPT
jgi:predicted ferric reductase